MSLRSKVIRLAHQNPELQSFLVPLLKAEKTATMDPLKHRITRKSMFLSKLDQLLGPVKKPYIDPVKASGLIETLLLHVPMHPLILWESYIDQKHEYHLVDGAWRLGVIKAFIAGEFALTGSAYFPNLEGMYFKQLNPRLQSWIEDTEISVLLLEYTMTKEMVDRYVKQVGHPKG